MKGIRFKTPRERLAARRATQARSRAKHSAKRAAYTVAYLRAHPEKRRVYQQRWRAKRRAEETL